MVAGKDIFPESWKYGCLMMAYYQKQQNITQVQQPKHKWCIFQMTYFKFDFCNFVTVSCFPYLHFTYKVVKILKVFHFGTKLMSFLFLFLFVWLRNFSLSLILKRLPVSWSRVTSARELFWWICWIFLDFGTWKKRINIKRCHYGRKYLALFKGNYLYSNVLLPLD